MNKRKFIARAHPNNTEHINNQRERFPKDVEISIKQMHFVGDQKKHYRFHFQEALNNCRAVITHNSTASTDSCIRGVPTFCTSDLAICWPVANTDLLKIESPIYPDRTQWLYDLGYMLWSIDEIRSGMVYKRFKDKLGF